MDWKTWSPFQSKTVKEICEHVTKDEKKEVVRRACMYGTWCALTFAIPVSFAILYRSPIAISVAIVLVVIHIVGIPIWQKKQKEFLCSTKWAKSKGYTPENIRLFGFGRNSR